MPRLSEPGPLGMRAEHWCDCGSLAENSDLFVQVFAHIAAAAVPNSVLQYLKAGQITPLAKPTGGNRPLLMMSFLHRLALKSAMAAKKESVARCAGPLQYGVGRPDGANTMIKTIQCLAEAESLLLLTSKRPSKMCLGNRCGSCSCLLQVVHRHHRAQDAPRLCLHQNQCQQEWIRVVLCQRVDFQRPLTLYSGPLWQTSAGYTIQALISLPTLTTGTCGSNRSIYC